MNRNASFLKRLSAFVVDLTLVIIVTWLLYLFPFNLIINKSIDKSYKNNIKKPYDAITEEYSGSVSYFGATTDGKFTSLKNAYNNGSMVEEDFDKYFLVIEDMYDAINDYNNNLLTDIEVPFDETAPQDDQFTSKLYAIYNYIDNAYAYQNEFPHDSNNIEYSVSLSKDDIIETEKNELVSAYKEKLLNDYSKCLESLLKAAKVYASKNSEANILNTLAVSSIESKYNTAVNKKMSDVEESFNADDVSSIGTFILEYKNYAIYQSSKTTLGTNLSDDGVTYVTYNKEVYYAMYYSLVTEEVIAQLPYYVQVYNHTRFSIIYALSTFTVLFSIYTLALRGATIGRRMVKIRLTDGKDLEKLNPVLALLHDVPFRILYIVVLGLFSLIIAMILMVGFTIADFIMIKFSRKHKCLRDLMSGTMVLEGLSTTKY